MSLTETGLKKVFADKTYFIVKGRNEKENRIIITDRLSHCTCSLTSVFCESVGLLIKTVLFPEYIFFGLPI